jgi:hypothetical protein
MVGSPKLPNDSVDSSTKGGQRIPEGMCTASRRREQCPQTQGAAQPRSIHPSGRVNDRTETHHELLEKHKEDVPTGPRSKEIWRMQNAGGSEPPALGECRSRHRPGSD